MKKKVRDEQPRAGWEALSSLKWKFGIWEQGAALRRLHLSEFA